MTETSEQLDLSLLGTKVLEIRDQNVHVFEYINEKGVREVTPVDQIIAVDEGEEPIGLELRQDSEVCNGYDDITLLQLTTKGSNKLGGTKSNTRCEVCKRRRIDGVILHFFPKTEPIRTIWGKLCRVKKVKSHMKLCSNHFTAEQYENECE